MRRVFVGVFAAALVATASVASAAERPRPNIVFILADDMGVGKPADFAWNKLLSFDACVQCGKCEAACPAFAAGQPLNPKKLIQDLVVGMSGTSDAAYAGSPYPGRPAGQHSGAPQLPIVGGLISSDTLWSCTTCRACVQECPMLIEHVDSIVDMRRHLTLVGGVLPNKGNEALDNLRDTDTVGGFPLAARHHWAADLNVPVLDAGYVISSYLFWPVMRVNGFVRPIANLGWTLNIEMMFYTVFTVGLLFRRNVGLAFTMGFLGLFTLLQTLGDGSVVRGNQAALARGDDLARMEGEAGQLGVAAHQLRQAQT